MSQRQRNSAWLMDDLYDHIAKENVDEVAKLLEMIDVDSLKRSMDSLFYEADKTCNERIIRLITRRNTEIRFPSPMKIEYEKVLHVPAPDGGYRSIPIHNMRKETKTVVDEKPSEPVSQEIYPTEPEDGLLAAMKGIFTPDQLQNPVVTAKINEVFNSTVNELSAIRDVAIFKMRSFRDNVIDEVD